VTNYQIASYEVVKKLVGFRPRKGVLLGIALVVFGALVLDVHVAGEGLSYREVIVAIAALMGGIIVLGGERGIQFGFVLWVLTLALGYRTIEWTPNLRIHPAEILLWLLLCCFLVQRHLVARSRLTLPLWIWLLIPFWVLAWWPLIIGDAHWDQMLNEFRNFLLLVPLMIVASVVLQRERYWRYLLLALFLTSTWIGLMGVAEYWFPGVARLFPAFVKDPTPTVTVEGFARAQFSFWGGPMAVFVCVMALPTAIILAKWWPRWFHRAVIVAASVTQIVAIYIAGYRSIWLILLIQVLAGCLCLLGVRKEGIIVALLCLVVAIGGYQLIPQKTSERAMSGMAALQGRPIDHSARDRKERALAALSLAIESPLGSGWNSAGWVHSDFLQVAANLGLVGGFIFLGGYIYTLIRLGLRALPYLRKGEQGDLGLSLLLAFIAAGAILAMEGVEVLPQLVLPVWFIWVVVEVWLRQTPKASELSHAVETAYNCQLRQVDYSLV
jgi:hypothetical protein